MCMTKHEYDNWLESIMCITTFSKSMILSRVCYGIISITVTSCSLLFQVSVRVRDKGDSTVMSMDSLLKHFKDEVEAFH